MTGSIHVEHVRVQSPRPFAEVVQRIEAATGLFDAVRIQRGIGARESPGALIDAVGAMAGPSGLMRFAALDFGALLRLHGEPGDAVRFLIGHPLIAVRMVRRKIASALYAPLSLLVAADGGNGSILEYDQPSTLLGQFNDAEVSRVALELDRKLDALVRSAAE